MPVGTCSECGQENVLGQATDGLPFLCCDCDSEMTSYNEKDRSDLKRASRERMEKFLMGPTAGGRRSSMLDAARSTLTQSGFNAEEDDEESAIKVATDKAQDFFAGMGSAEVGPSCAALCLYLQGMIQSEEEMSILELGAGTGAVGLWLWKKNKDKLTVCLTDVPRLVPLLSLNCEANFGFQGIISKPLRWGIAADIDSFTSSEQQPFDLLVGADACINEAKAIVLFDTIVRLKPRRGAILAQSVHPAHQADGESAINALEREAEEAGWRFERIDEVNTGVVHPQAEGEYYSVLISLSPAEDESERLPMMMQKTVSSKE